MIRWKTRAISLTLTTMVLFGTACAGDDAATPLGPITSKKDMAGFSDVGVDMAGVDMSSGVDMAKVDMFMPVDMKVALEEMGADMPPSMDMQMEVDGIKTEDLGPTACTSDSNCTDPKICLVNPKDGGLFCGDPVGPKMPGDRCMMGTECRSGLCLNGECANPCDDKSNCPNGFNCEDQTIPLEGGANATVKVCVEQDKPCLADPDCTDPEVCVIDRSNGLELLCKEPLPGGKDLGEACGTDNECRSGLCLENVCARPCQRPNDCSMDGSFICEPTTIAVGAQNRQLNLCKPKPPTQCLSDSQCNAPEACIASRQARSVDFTCDSPNNGGAAVGSPCNSDSSCAANFCLNNICTIPCQGNGDCTAAADYTCENQEVDLGGGNKDNVQVCTPPVVCQNDNACKVSEVCYVRTPNGGIDSICRAPNNNGGTLGQLCTGDIACRSNICLEGRFDDVCSLPCVDNNDCSVPGYECRNEEVKPGLNARVCAPKAPPTCLDNDDCATGLTCAIVPNVAGNSLESVCIPSTGKGATGLACSNDNVCASRLCLDNVCAAPCRDISDCGQDQVCDLNNVSKSGLSGSFRVCEKLTDTLCNSTSDCTDGVRVCGGLRQNSAMTALETFCRFPNTQGAALGATCTTGNDCRQGICLNSLLSSLPDECSVFCSQDANCSTTANQICTSLTRDINACMRGCTDNGSCPTGEVCTLRADFASNDVDQVCVPPVGTKLLGESCGAMGDVCENGLCVESIGFTATTCTDVAQCNAGEECRCPVGQPGCTTGKRCAAVTPRCSRICNGNDDCVGNATNTLTACSTDVTVTLPDGITTKTFSACGEP